jgi:hypothetical protein
MPTDFDLELEPEPVEEEAPEVEPEPEPEPPDEMALLKAEVERLKSLDSVAADLRRSVGRIQSLEAKLAEVEGNANKNDVVDQINKQFGSVTELLASVVENIDDTALDPATKQRVREAYSTSQRAAEKASLRSELIEELKPREVPQPQSSLPNGLSPETVQVYERAVVRQLERAGLNPDTDYDWKQASAVLVRGGTLDELLDIADKAVETAQATTRRQAAKKSAGAGSPNGASASGDAADRLGSAKTLDEGVALLRSMGVNV